MREPEDGEYIGVFELEPIYGTEGEKISAQMIKEASSQNSEEGNEFLKFEEFQGWLNKN